MVYLNHLKSKIIFVLERNESGDTTMKNYLIHQLEIDKQIPEEKKDLIQKNFIHLMCQIRNDLYIIDERLKKYKCEREKLERIKSNEMEYRRRKLEYFVKLNKKAQDDIVSFLVKDITKYLLDSDYDTLDRESIDDEFGKMFRNRRYLFAQVSEYYDADFDYSTVVKVSQLPDVELIDRLRIEKKYLEMHRDNPQEYYVEIRKLIGQKKVMENLKFSIEQNYHLYKRREIFMDLARLYNEGHYQSFIALGLLQLEGIFFDICSIRYDEKENAGSLVEKAEKALNGKNEISYMRYYPYFAFDVPVKRNEIAHTGLVKSKNFGQLADEVLLDLNAVVQMARLESEKKFRVFKMIYSALLEGDFSDEMAINKKMLFELFAYRDFSDSFWDILKTPDQFEEEINFYREDDVEDGNIDLPAIVKKMSYMVYQLPFWSETQNTLNAHGEKYELREFILKMAKNYVGVLKEDSKNKCIEILSILK